LCSGPPTESTCMYPHQPVFGSGIHPTHIHHSDPARRRALDLPASGIDLAPAERSSPGSNRFPKVICRPDRIPKRTPSRSRHSRGICSASRCIEALPSDDAVPFEVVVGQVPPSLCSMMHADQKACERQFATYNLLTVYADKVVFTRYLGGGLLEASGNVVVKDDHGEYRRDLANFFIGGGRAVPVY
jgi:hypothetical protein